MMYMLLFTKQLKHKHSALLKEMKVNAYFEYRVENDTF